MGWVMLLCAALFLWFWVWYGDEFETKPITYTKASELEDTNEEDFLEIFNNEK